MVCLRIFNAYGPRQRGGPYSGVITQFIDRLRKGEPIIIHGDGNQTRDFIHVRDVVNALISSMERKEAIGEVINIGSGRSISINELVRTLSELYGEGSVKVRHTPPRKGDIRHSCADIRRAFELLKFKPKVELREGLRELLRRC
jgi:UDP-glucose 4-epimerase